VGHVRACKESTGVAVAQGAIRGEGDTFKGQGKLTEDDTSKFKLPAPGDLGGVTAARAGAIPAAPAVPRGVPGRDGLRCAKGDKGVCERLDDRKG
jgi:hypothetical protein